MSHTAVAPHKFEPLGRIFHRHRCRRCFVRREAHPTFRWTTARPLGFKGHDPHAKYIHRSVSGRETP